MILLRILFQYLSLSLGSLSYVDADRNEWVGFGGLVGGHQICDEETLSQHWRCRLSRCWGFDFVCAFSPDEHASQKDGQGNPNHGGWWCERPMSVSWLDLVEFLKELTGIKLTILKPWMAMWMPSMLALLKSSVSYPVQSMVFFWISTVSDSSADITWSMVRMKQPGSILTVSPDLI